MAEGPSGSDVTLHADLGLLDERRRGFFSRLSRQQLKHAVFDSLGECVAATEGCIEHRNATYARPFRWSRTPEDLVEARKMRHQKLQQLAS